MSAGCAGKQAPGPSAPAPVAKKDPDVITAARSNIGVPYKYGGNSPETGFDCSGFVCWTYEQVGVSLPRRARDQLAFGKKVDKKDLQPGDIVVFKGTRNRSGWHSGIYTGDGKFIHSPRTGRTVTESLLDEKYYAQRYAGACRIPQDGTAQEMYARYLEKERATANAARAAKNKPGKKKTTVAATGNGQNAKKTANKNTSRSARKKTEKS